MDLMLLAGKPQATRECLTARCTDDITDDENSEPVAYLRAEAFAFRCFTKYTMTRFSSR